MAKRVYIGVGGKARKVKKIYIGVAGVARKVKKAYIGVGGVARIFWSGGALEYYGTATALSSGRTYHAAATVGNYALFGGGYSYSSGYMTTVDAYSASLIRSTPTALSVARYKLAAAAVGNYALFIGGYYYDGEDQMNSTTIDVYNTSLTRSTMTAAQVCFGNAAATVGDYILYVRNNSANSVVASIDASLTKGTAASLSTARYDLAAMTLGDFALFGGGCTSSSSRSAVVDSYDASLTMTVATSLSLAREYPQGIQVGDYGLFAGGNNGSSSGSYSAVVDVYTI